MGAGTNGAVGVILTEGSWVSIVLAFAALCASSIGGYKLPVDIVSYIR